MFKYRVIPIEAVQWLKCLKMDNTILEQSLTQSVSLIKSSIPSASGCLQASMHAKKLRLYQVEVASQAKVKSLKFLPSLEIPDVSQTVLARPWPRLIIPLAAGRAVVGAAAPSINVACGYLASTNLASPAARA